MEFFSVLLQGLSSTLTIWLLSMTIAVIVGIPVAACRLSKFAFLRGIASVWIGVLRGVPSLLWIFILFFGVSIGAVRPTPFLAAGIALGIVGSAYMGEIYRSALQALPKGQFEALSALGMSRIAGLRVVLLPQCVPLILAGGASYAIHLVKDTAMASLIGVQDIVFLANDSVHRGGDGLLIMAVAGVIYVLLSMPLGYGARLLTNRIGQYKQVLLA